MNIQLMSGGLANQIRQYVFVRYVERRNPEQIWIFDDTYFFQDDVPHNGYELESVFGLQVNLASRYFPKDVWDGIVRLSKQGAFLPQILLNAGLPVVLEESTTGHGFFHGETVSHIPGEYTSEVWTYPYSNMYYFDYWIEDDWFHQDREENLKELCFPALTDAPNLRYASWIEESMSVGIHIRRGGFVDNGWAVSEQEYLCACQKTLARFPEAHFFVFSDELDWCKAHAEEMGLNLADRTIYVEGNDQGKNYIDMQLMSMCRGIIRPDQSSFSQVAAWLNCNLKFETKLEKIYT